MNTERIEELLEQLIAKQDDIISRLETLESVVEGKLAHANFLLDESNLNLKTLESVVEEKLDDANFNLNSIHEELNWWEDKPSLAKQLLSSLEHIDTSLQSIDISISTLER